MTKESLNLHGNRSVLRHNDHIGALGHMLSEHRLKERSGRRHGERCSERKLRDHTDQHWPQPTKHRKQESVMKLRFMI